MVPPYFITIPSITGTKCYIKPLDILHIVEDNEVTKITFQQLNEARYVQTLISGDEIHNMMKKIDELSYKYLSGE